MLQNPFQGTVYEGAKLGESRGRNPREKGTRPQEATQEEAQCPPLWKLSSCPLGRCQRRKSRAGRKGLRESCHGGLIAKQLVIGENNY